MPATKKQVIKAMVEQRGFNKESAEELLAKHIDIFQVNKDECSAYEIALFLEEEYLQNYDEED